MWSVVQRRQIRQQVQHELSQGKRDVKTVTKNEAPENAAPERERSPSSLERQDDAEKAADLPDSQDARFVVKSSGDEDPLDPRNWPLTSRCKNIAILSVLIFVQAWAGAAESMANTAASQEFHVSSVNENLSTAMYLFGVGTGALFVGSLSETVGRNPTYLVSTFCYLCFVLGCALTPTFGGQVVCRYFIGLTSSATLAINGGSVRDQFRPVKRAFVFPVIAWANVAAPVIAPIASGWIVSDPRLGWRWTEWITLIVSGAAFLVALFFLPETYFPLLLDWKAKELRRATGEDRYTSEHAEKSSFLGRLKHTLPLPAKFLRTEPVITVLGLYLVFLYILLFTSLSGFDYIFKKTYMLSPGLTGSCFASIAAGSTAFTLCAPGLYSWARHHTEHVRGAHIKPEFRLWPAIVTSPFLPISLFWIGWSNYSTISIWSGLLACFTLGVVLTAFYVSSYEYIIDSYRDHAAIALATITSVRYLIAGGMVMAARPMYEAIGVHWTMTLLGCVAALLCPAPLLFYFYGAKLRAKSPYAKGPEEDD
ncbi:Fc.00g084510.m01.CDS01 [Cosmosporella sp. VM-42]